jgi:glycine C-acetyltransferase
MNQTFEDKLQGDLNALRAAGTYKHLRHITTPMAPEVHMEEAGDVIVLSSNNYLGLADLTEVVEAGKRGLDRYGAGTASVRFICGTFDIHRTLETKIASFLGTEASLSYVACWNANTGLFATICDHGSAIISDELNHASIIDGVRLASKARRERYKHSDMQQLREKLEAVKGCFPIVIVTDGVFSMEGDLAKLPEIVELASARRNHWRRP